MFQHHNPLINKDNYNYYVRCVNRFQNLLLKQELKLFIIIIPNMNNIDENVKKKILEFNNKFSKHTTNYILLVIFNISEKENNNHNFIYNNNIHFLELHTLSNSNGVIFLNNNDNIYLNNLIKSKYNFNIID